MSTKPSTSQVCNTQSCSETRCDSNNYYWIRRWETDYSSDDQSGAIWNGVIVGGPINSVTTSINFNGYTYSATGNPLSTCGVGSWGNSCYYFKSCNPGVGSGYCNDYCISRKPI